MEHERKKLATELETYRQAIVRAVDEIQEMEIVLDRTTTLYMEALKERKQMINQWTQSISILQQRDTDIQNCLRVGFLYFFTFLLGMLKEIYIARYHHAGDRNVAGNWQGEEK